MNRKPPRERTPFHKAVRAIQLDYGIRLATLSEALGIATPAARRLIAGSGPVPPWLVPRLAEALGLDEAARQFLEQAAEATAMSRQSADAERDRIRIVMAFERGLKDVGLEGDESEDTVRIRRLVGARS